MSVAAPLVFATLLWYPSCTASVRAGPYPRTFTTEYSLAPVPPASRWPVPLSPFPPQGEEEQRG